MPRSMAFSKLAFLASIAGYACTANGADIVLTQGGFYPPAGQTIIVPSGNTVTFDNNYIVGGTLGSYGNIYNRRFELLVNGKINLFGSATLVNDWNSGTLKLNVGSSIFLQSATASIVNRRHLSMNGYGSTSITSPSNPNCAGLNWKIEQADLLNGGGGIFEIPAGVTLNTNLCFWQTYGGTTIVNGKWIAGGPNVYSTTLKGGVLAGAGQITPFVANPSVTVAPGTPNGNAIGTLTITGPIDWQATLQLEMKGTGAGQYDRLVIMGHHFAKGDESSKIVVKLINGFLPVKGNRFEVISVDPQNQYNGYFHSQPEIEWPPLPSDRGWQAETSSDGKKLVLTVI